MAAAAPRGNLDTDARGTQMRLGLVALVVALVAVVALSRSGAAPGYRALAFVPFFVAAYGVMAALYCTCGITALAGRRITTDGSERIADRSELARQRAVGLRVLGMSAALAAAATVLFVIAS